MKIVFRADSSLEIGSGHVMRCLTLAKVLRDHGAECQFICRAHSGNLCGLIQEQGLSVGILDHKSDILVKESAEDTRATYRRWLGAPSEVDAAETIAAIGADKPDWVVVDHYGIDHQWETKLRPHCNKIMVIDDLADRPHNCDLLLDQNLIKNFENRYKTLVPEGCPCLLGPGYALLQPEYALAHPRTPPRLGPISRILVYFGGADQQNLTASVIDAFLRLDLDNVTLDVVVNSRSPHYDSVRQLASSADHVVLHENLPSLCDLMISADICIGASGATSWERCCLGLPAYVVTLAENQVPIAKSLDESGFAIWMGDQAEITVDSIESSLRQAFEWQDDLMNWSSHCRTLVDGKGAERVVSVMTIDKETPLNVRRAELRDEQLLLEWANDLLVRKNAFTSDPIDAKTHRRWFYNRLRAPKSSLIFIVQTQAGMPIGQVRFDLNSDNAWEIDYSVSAIVRGRNIATLVLGKAVREFQKLQEAPTIIADVKLQNNPSQKVLEKIGFIKHGKLMTRGRGGELCRYMLRSTKFD